MAGPGRRRRGGCRNRGRRRGGGCAQGNDRHPAVSSASTAPDAGGPASQAVAPTTAASLPWVMVATPGSVPASSLLWCPAGPPAASDPDGRGRRHRSRPCAVVRTTDAEFDAPYPEGDHTMDPISAPTGEAWVLHPVLDRTWSPRAGRSRGRLVVDGQRARAGSWSPVVASATVELAALLPSLTFDGVAWAWPGSAANGMAEIPAQHRGTSGSSARRRRPWPTAPWWRSS